jgi:hypothetical protein
VFDRFDLQRAFAIGHVHALASARSERHDFIGGERPLGQNPEHFPADIAGRTDNGDAVTHP